MSGYYPTVIDSQVFSWLEVTKSLFENNHIVNLGSKGEVKLNSEAKRNLEKRINGKYIEFKRSKRIIIREIQLLVFVSRIYFKLNGKQKLILQSRSKVFSTILPIMKLLPRLRYVQEARGTAIIEYMYAREKGVAKPRRYWIVRFREYMSLKYADMIICVSTRQNDYIISKYRVKKDNILVVPCAADSNRFFLSENIGHRMRAEYGIGNKIVFIYSGALDQQWHQKESIFNTIKKIKSALPESYFIILSPNIDIAMQLFEKHKISQSDFMVKYADNRDVTKYLNAADYGFLIREDSPINHHASPTKFSEYILCGLKVIMSSNIGDYSDFAREHQCGIVGDFSEAGLKINYQDLEKVSKEEKERISQLGLKYLSKQALLPQIRDTYRRII